MKGKFYKFLVLMLLAPAFLVAQDVFVLEVSTASKKKEKLSDAPGIITVLNEKDIQGWGGQNLGDVLNKVTSFYFIHAGTYFYNVGSIRGQNISVFDNHVLILLNGRPVRDGISGGHNNYFYLSFPIDIIKQIEVIRGPGSVLYGTNAYSGVINILTKEPTEEGIHGYADVSYGSFNTLAEGANITYKKEDFSLSIAARNFNEDGPEYTVADGPKSGGSVTKTDNFEKDNRSVFLNSKYKNASLNLFYGSAHPFALVPPIKWGVDKNGDGEADLVAGNGISRMEHLFGDIGYELKPAEWASVSINATYNRQQWIGEIWDSEQATTLDDKTHALSNAILGEATANLNPVEDLNVIVGGTYETNTYSGEILNDGDKSVFSSYAQLDYRPIDLVKLIGGIQYNKAENIDGEFTPRVGAVFSFTENIGLKVLHGSAFRSAYPQEIDVIHPVYRGDSSLKPEMITTTEAQLMYQTGKLQTSLAYYNSHMEDLINKVPSGDTITQFKFKNEGSHDFQGIEFEAKYAPNNMFTLTGSFTYQDNESDDTLKTSVIWPSTMLKLGVLYNHDLFSVGLFNNSILETEKIENPVVTSNPEAEDYNLLSLKVSSDMLNLFQVETKNKLILSLYADNLLDEEIWFPEFARGEINTLPLRNGRALWGSVKFKF